MSSTLDTKELEFALKVRRTLDEGAAQLPQATVSKLAAARQAALARKKPEPAPRPALIPALAGAGGRRLPAEPAPRGFAPGFAQLGRFGLIWPILALVVTLAGVAYWEDQQRIADLADIDAAMLSDNLPLNAYLDHGFHAYLARTR
jgi:hypothetical protein